MSKIATAIVSVIALTLAPAAFAAKGGNSNGNSTHDPSLSLVMVNDVNGDGLPNWADTVRFDAVTTDAYAAVELDCTQGGVLVYRGVEGVGPSYPSQDFMLSSTMWTGGAADCAATLYSTSSSGKQTTLATLAFQVGA
jgi:hypothetical protein